MNTRNLVLGTAVALTMSTLIFAASANAGGLLGGVGGGIGGGLTRSPDGIGGSLDGNIAGNAQFDRGSLAGVRNAADRTKTAAGDKVDTVKSRAAQTTAAAKDTAKNASTPPATSKSPEPAAPPAHHVNAAAAVDAE